MPISRYTLDRLAWGGMVRLWPNSVSSGQPASRALQVASTVAAIFLADHPAFSTTRAMPTSEPDASVPVLHRLATGTGEPEPDSKRTLRWKLEFGDRWSSRAAANASSTAFLYRPSRRRPPWTFMVV